MKKLLTALMLAAMLSMTMALSTMAAPGGGATTSTTPYSIPKTCREITSLALTVCSQIKGVYHTTITPAGTRVYTGSGSSSYTVTGPNGVLTGTVKFSYQEVSRDGMLQVLSDKFSNSFTSGGVTCTASFDVHEANGKLQFDRVDYSCTP